MIVHYNMNGRAFCGSSGYWITKVKDNVTCKDCKEKKDV